MKIRLLSDIHLEFGYLNVPETQGEENEVLVLAGDVGIASKTITFVPFLEEMSERFRDVVYIMGNHEHYHGSIRRSLLKIKREIDHHGDIHNVHIINNLVVQIENVSFVCSTMWASYDKNSPLTVWEANTWMNDHKIVRTGPDSAPYQRKFKADDAFEEYMKAINFIFPAIKEEKEKGQKVVVVTHHGPSYQSVPERFRSGEWAKLNGAYVSDLDDDIIDSKPDIWVHGHTHDSFDYMIEDTRVVCNPRGYVGHEINPEFDPTLTLEIDD